VSDPSNPAAPTAGARPSSVTISSYLLYAVAAIQVIGLILALSFIGKTQQVYKEVYAGTSVEGAESFGIIGIVIGAVVGLLLAVGLVVLATLNNRGRNVSRIVTWVVGGIGVCCIGGSLGTGALTGSMNSGNGDVPSPSDVQRRLDEVLPSWYGPVSTTLTVLSLIGLLVALILLALPASNEFFRKPQAAGWEPPVPGATYPGYPQSTPPAAGQQGDLGYPQTPGYPLANPQDPRSNPPGDQSGPPAPPAG
jgi:hypothetical protein